MPSPEIQPTSRPRILLTSSFDWGEKANFLGSDYCGAVEAVGGLPLILPAPYSFRAGLAPGAGALAAEYAAEALSACDGLLLPGGVDFDPETFGEAPLPGLGEVDGARDVYEIALIQAALAKGLPLLGICRGCQALAIAAGGAIYQDLPSQRPTGLIKHRQTAQRFERTHYVSVEPDSLLAELLGASGDGGDRPSLVKVNSFHHQAISRVPAGFRVSAKAPDGVLEAIEAVDRPRRSMALGVQWHPENLWQVEPRFLGLFAGLVKAARLYRDGD